MSNNKSNEEKTITINLPDKISLPMVMGVMLVLSLASNVIMWNRVKDSTGTAPLLGAKENNSGLLQNQSIIRDIKVAEVTEEDYLRGNKDARFVLIEYSDYDCPFCTRFHVGAQGIVDKYEGEVAWVFRHFPLVQIHPNARAKAEAAECVGLIAGDEKFWEFTDALYDTERGEITLDETKTIAAEININTTEWQKCVDNKDSRDEVNADIDSGQEAKVSGTPGNVVLDRKTGKAVLISGNIPSLVEDIIEEFKSLDNK